MIITLPRKQGAKFTDRELMRFKAPKILRNIMPSLIWELESEQEVYITFDDGPTAKNTEWIVKKLAEYGDAKATFFCLGKNAEQHRESYDLLVDAGHRIGNHTYSHRKGWEMSVQRYIEDVDFANQLFHTDLFRPPYGRITRAQARMLSQRYDIIMWDVLSRDYSRYITPRQCANNVIKHVKSGSIVVFHDSPKSSRNMRYALPRTLDHIYEKGLICAPIEL